jgi:hypothetical protein
MKFLFSGLHVIPSSHVSSVGYPPLVNKQSSRTLDIPCHVYFLGGSIYQGMELGPELIENIPKVVFVFI